MNLTIIDFTSLIYSASFNTAKTGSELFTDYTDNLNFYLNNVLKDTNADAFIIFIDTHSSFCKEMYASYKATRTKMYFKFLNDLTHYSKEVLGAISVDGLEADDLVLIHANEYKDLFNITIAYKDKDLLQMEGKFFDYKRYKNNQTIEEATIILTKEQADLNLYTQCLKGDSVDNIKGLIGCGEQTAKTYFQNVEVTFENTKEAFVKGIPKELGGRFVGKSFYGIIDFYKAFNQVYLLRTQHEAAIKGLPFELVTPSYINV